MATRMIPSLRCLYWSAFFLPTVIAAQDNLPERTPGALGMGSSITFAAAFPVIRNEPYTANVLTREIRLGPDGKTIVHEALNIHSRDSLGRLRDQTLPSSPDSMGSFTQASVQVVDPIAMQDIQWNADTKTVFTSTIPAAFRSYRQAAVGECAARILDSPIDNHSQNQNRTSYENLGERTIEDIHAQGCKITRAIAKRPGFWSGTTVMEIWSSKELQINLITTEKDSDGTIRLTQLTGIHRGEPDPRLFLAPANYTDPLNQPKPATANTNPNYAAIREYGRIEWHGDTATLIAGSSRPLDMAALTLSTCLGIPVSSEDPQYHYLGDLLDVTAPQWAAQHPDRRASAAKPGKIEVTFNIDQDGLPRDPPQLLQDVAKQANREQSNIYGYRVLKSAEADRTYYSFVPTSTHNERNILEQVPAYLDSKITIAPRTTTVAEFAYKMTMALSAATSMQFSCCQPSIVGRGWGTQRITYHATDQQARKVMEDLLTATGGKESYILRCQPLDKRWCFITVHTNEVRTPDTSSQSGVCSARGYDSR